MHSYPLHRRVEAECVCCHLISRFEFGSKSDFVICKGCIRHTGELKHQLQQRDIDHLNLWRSELALAAQGHAEAIAQLKAAVAEREEELRSLRLQLVDARHAIETELRARPMASLQGWWDSIQIGEANDARDRSYRSRDHALRALWRLDKLHHDGSTPNHCSCGKTTGKCSEWKVIEDDREFLYRWESKQIERLQADQDHGLPDEHPEVMRTGRRSWRYAG